MPAKEKRALVLKQPVGVAAVITPVRAASTGSQGRSVSRDLGHSSFFLVKRCAQPDSFVTWSWFPDSFAGCRGVLLGPL